MIEHEKEQPSNPRFNEAINRAVEVFHRDELTDHGEPMDGGYAWAAALHELIETDQDALELATEIVNDPVLSAFIPYWEGESDTFRGYVCAALCGSSSEPFVATIANEIPDYDKTVAHRKSLLDVPFEPTDED